MSIQKVSLFLHGFNSRSQCALAEYIASNYVNMYQMVETEKQADISIVNVGIEFDEKFVKNKRNQFQKKPILVISQYDFENMDPLTFVLKKPLAYEALVDLLGQINLIIPKNRSVGADLNYRLASSIKSKLQFNKQEKNILCKQKNVDSVHLQSLVGKQDTVDLSNPQGIMRVIYDPSVTILASLKKAIERARYENKMLELINFNKSFVIDPITQTIFTFVSSSVLRPLCLLPLRETSVVKRLKKGRKSNRFNFLMQYCDSEVTEWRWDSFLWKMSLWTSRGKIPKNIDIHLPVYLSEWPNLTKLEKIPHAINIAALMYKQALTLSEIANQLAIPQRYVFAFFNAAYNLGIADNSDRQCDQFYTRNINELSKNKGLLLQDTAQLFMNYSSQKHPTELVKVRRAL